MDRLLLANPPSPLVTVDGHLLVTLVHRRTCLTCLPSRALLVSKLRPLRIGLPCYGPWNVPPLILYYDSALLPAGLLIGPVFKPKACRTLKCSLLSNGSFTSIPSPTTGCVLNGHPIIPSCSAAPSPLIWNVSRTVVVISWITDHSGLTLLCGCFRSSLWSMIVL